jgi:hypothetical protein
MSGGELDNMDEETLKAKYEAQLAEQVIVNGRNEANDIVIEWSEL